jgi:uncharacterized MAPEG superfamily protein
MMMMVVLVVVVVVVLVVVMKTRGAFGGPIRILRDPRTNLFKTRDVPEKPGTSGIPIVWQPAYLITMPLVNTLVFNVEWWDG